MKHTKSEILNALHVIKDTCYEKYEEDGSGSCYLCPFSDSDGHCILSEQSPMAWDINDDEPWRALK